MKYTRPILLAASALALFISACAQPQDLKTTELGTQFGTADGEAGVDVTAIPAGGTYVVSDQEGPLSDPEYYAYTKVLLHRYTSTGSQLWIKEVDLINRTTHINDDGRYVRAKVVQGDASGNAYVLYSRSSIEEDSRNAYRYTVRSYSVNGTLRSTFNVGTTRAGFNSPGDYADMAVDTSGNVYVAIVDSAYGSFEVPKTNLLRKYSPSGSLLWERTSGVGTPTGVAIASDGIIYLSGVGGLARYTSAGTVVWKKSGFYNDVATSGSSVYTRNKNNVFAFNSSGQPLWSRFIGGLGNVIIQDLSGDTNGNLYVSGKYPVSGNNWNAFVRKFSASGRSQWSKTYGTPAYDDATGISTLSGSDIYVTGVTLGSLAHPNRGAEDGYVRKLSSVGNLLWTR